MNEVKLLTVLELRSMYGINKFIYTKDLKAKKRYIAISAIWIFLILMIFGYVSGLVYGLFKIGLSEIVPSYLVMIASLVIFIFGIFRAGSTIFSHKGYDIISSMPIKTSSVVLSRFLTMYIEDLLFTLVIMLPGVVVYGICQHPNIGFYIIAFLGSIFVPAIPLVISTIIGTGITAITSKMKHKSIIQTILIVILLAAIMIGSYGSGKIIDSLSIEKITKLASYIGGLIGQIYAPAVWIGNAMVNSDFLPMIIFIAVSVVLSIVMLLIVSPSFHKITSRLLVNSAKHNYKVGTLGQHGMLRALYTREAKRYFSSTIYVTNTIIGPIMGFMMAVALLIVGADKIKESIPMDIDIAGLLPFVFSAIFCMMNTTSTSISMEGKQIWVVKSMPVPSKTWIDSKLLLNFSLMLPFYVLSEVFFMIAIKPSFMELLWLILIPAMLILASTVLGIVVNLRLYSFDWEKEETVVKQSFNSMLGGFAGPIISAIFGFAVFFVSAQYGDMLKSAICICLAVITVLLYKGSIKVKLSEL